MQMSIEPERFTLLEHPYPEFARGAFDSLVGPLLQELLDDNPDFAEVRQPIVAYSSASQQPGSFRLFPGSLYLLLRKCFDPEYPFSTGDLRTAAAIELSHNATLIHDDNLDNHLVRHARATLVATYGHGPSVMYGCIALLLGFSEILTARDGVATRHLLILRDALESCCVGQLLDEPSCWTSIQPTGWLEHWNRICSLKLRVGDVGAYLVAEDLPSDHRETLRRLFSDFSPVSQMINDFNDLTNHFGYHKIAPDSRAEAEEGRLKPTFPTILVAEAESFKRGRQWNAYLLDGDPSVRQAVFERAQRMFRERKETAWARMSSAASRPHAVDGDSQRLLQFSNSD